MTTRKDGARKNVAELLSEQFNESDKLEVYIADQTSPPLIVPLNKISYTTTLAAGTTIGITTTITVVDPTGFAEGSFLAITNTIAKRFYTATVTAVVGSDITLDCPVDFAFLAGDKVAVGSSSLIVDGTLTNPQIFSLRAADPTLDVTIDVTRIMIECQCSSPVSLAKFGDLPALINGLCIRRVDGTYQNIVNFKSNGDMAGVGYDWEPFLATNPAQNVDGFVYRLTFAGQNKMGVAIRVGPNEDLQALVQDSLATPVTGELFILKINVEGHVVID
jgi:hypothetical protein